ncbi:restriction endonuclease subunit S [Vibrio sp. 1CM24A]|uniref:restriction endonuclease subunit S n=1 Tax=Vibrio sp. 1CM24A TaxID=2929165 RepID=UPI0020BDE0A6|nr:restriction endonuclease subunit S [Vibrio sp. 1CM24A]MCK8083748.1 restriction endonuclease subunit S [Vibrio sp. 1CM24A]
MSNYPAYSEYKPTHLGWLHEIPAHWEVKRLKYLGEAIIGLTYSPDDAVDNSDEGTLVLRSSNVQNKQLAFEDNVYVNKKIPEKLKTQLGDILICARNGSRALIGKNAQIDKQGLGMTFGAFMSVFRSPYNDYLSKVFNSALFEYQSGSFLTATINQLTTANLNSFEIPLPPKDERLQIANFLDHETAKIDTLIDKQQQLIKLLKEKRQAVISHAVTKGLNPDAPMKDSGVEWLGEVPEQWIVVKCGYLGRLFGSETIADTLIGDDGDIPFIKVSTLSLDTFDLAEKSFFVDSSKVTTSKAKSNYIVFPKRGAAIFTNKVNFVRENSFIDPNLMGWELNEKVMPEYVAYMLKLRGLGDIADVSTVPQINNKHIEPMKFPLPPIKEQEEILEALKGEVSNFNTLVQKSREAIALMQERRTALISAAVTGKIDVRNWQAPVNQEVQQQEAGS